MLEWWLPRVSGVRDRDYIPMGPKMLPENGVIRFADFPALEVEVGYRRRPQNTDGRGLTMNLRSFEKANLRAASIRSNESSESLMLFIGTNQPLDLFRGRPSFRG